MQSVHKVADVARPNLGFKQESGAVKENILYSVKILEEKRWV